LERKYHCEPVSCESVMLYVQFSPDFACTVYLTYPPYTHPFTILLKLSASWGHLHSSVQRVGGRRP